jgi:hypothetical protein
MKYNLSLFLTTLFSFALIVGWNKFMPVNYQNNDVYAVVIFFSLFSYIAHLFLSSSLNAENKNAFTLRFMAMSGIKLFISLFIIVIYAFLNKKQIVSFAIIYLLLYFLFTGFETFFLYKKINSREK